MPGKSGPRGGAQNGRAPGRKPGRAARREEQSTEDLLARYRRRRTARIRDAVVERHRGDVEAIARTLAARLPSRVDVDDLVHAGMWGLLQSIEKFRADRGAAFRPFMRPRVRGAMLDELRNLDFLPRLYRRRQRDRDAATMRVQERLGREPSDAELAEELGVDEARFRRLYGTLSVDGLADPGSSPARPRALDGECMDGLPDETHDGPSDHAERIDLIRTIESALQPIEWTVLRLHYLEGLSGKEIAERLHLSASRICQIHVRVLARLKARLGVSRAGSA